MSQNTLTQPLVQCHPQKLIFIQSRAEINFAVVNEYAEMMLEGTVFDPVEGIQDEDGQTFVWDGYHRGEAAKKAGTRLLVNLKPGTRIEAEWLALTANQKHGLRRTNKDKQRVVRQALLHPYGVNLSNSELARHCGVSDKTVAKIRRELELSSEIPKIDKRLVRRNGATYELDTSDIGNTLSEQQCNGRQPDGISLVRQHRQPPDHFKHDPVESNSRHLLSEAIPIPDHARLFAGLRSNGQAIHQPEHQDFECPRCGQEKIVGVNGSRRWCLSCLAEWPTAAEFLAAVNAIHDQAIQIPTRQQLQKRFLNILAQIDERELGKINTWLDSLETWLAFVEESHFAEADAHTRLNSHRMLEYA